MPSDLASLEQLSAMSEQQPIIVTDGNDNELIAELSTELNSDDLRRLASWQRMAE